MAPDQFRSSLKKIMRNLELMDKFQRFQFMEEFRKIYCKNCTKVKESEHGRCFCDPYWDEPV